MAGVIGGLSVAFKQLIPDQRIDIRFRQLRVHVSVFFLYIFINHCKIILNYNFINYHLPTELQSI